MVDQEILEKLHSGIESARSGLSSLARMQFEEITRRAPELADGWLWQAWVAETPADAILCLERVLELEPHNHLALSGITFLRGLLGHGVRPYYSRPPQPVRTRVDTVLAADDETASSRAFSRSRPVTAEPPVPVAGSSMQTPPAPGAAQFAAPAAAVDGPLADLSLPSAVPTVASDDASRTPVWDYRQNASLFPPALGDQGDRGTSSDSAAASPTETPKTAANNNTPVFKRVPTTTTPPPSAAPPPAIEPPPVEPPISALPDEDILEADTWPGPATELLREAVATESDPVGEPARAEEPEAPVEEPAELAPPPATYLFPMAGVATTLLDSHAAQPEVADEDILNAVTPVFPAVRRVPMQPTAAAEHRPVASSNPAASVEPPPAAPEPAAVEPPPPPMAEEEPKEPSTTSQPWGAWGTPSPEVMAEAAASTPIQEIRQQAAQEEDLLEDSYRTGDTGETAALSETNFDGPRGPLVMVVDDSPTVRKMIEVALRANSYRVLLAADGLEAVNLLNVERPDLILLDITMPRLDGYKVCRLVKRHNHTRDIPVVMLSGKDGMFDRLKGKMAGCDDYLTKPFDPALLLSKISEMLVEKRAVPT